MRKIYSGGPSSGNSSIFFFAFLIQAIFFLASNPSFAQTTVFSDDFSANTSANWTKSGSIGLSSWSVSRASTVFSGADWGARRNTSPEQLELTNDVDTTNLAGWVLASLDNTSFSSPYNSTLSSISGSLVTWTFNMRQIRSDPAGFSSTTSYGVAFILAGTADAKSTTGSGYAIVLGQSGSTDPVRLVKFTGGLQGTLTNVIESNTSG